MTLRTHALVVPLLLALAVSACGSGAPKAPGKDVLLAELRKEALAIKQENEGQDASLGVTATWNVASVEVKEPAAGDAPWKGTIRFQIHSETRDGSKVQVDELEKTFDYTYNPTIKKWIFDYKPS